MALGWFGNTQQKYSTIMIDFIATRDILPDEEILINYGA